MKKLMMLTMLVGFVMIYSGVEMATGQQQSLNEQSQQIGNKLEIREVSQEDKLTEVQEIPDVATLLAEEYEAPVAAENPLQQRKVQLRDVMENRVASLVRLIEQDKPQTDKKQTDQLRELQKKMEDIQKELGQMFLEYMALSEKLAEQTDAKTAQQDQEFLGRVLKLHKEADIVKLEKVAEADENIVKFYVSGEGVQNVNVGAKDGQVIYRIKTSDSEEKVLTAKELGDSKLVDEIKLVFELNKVGELKETEELKKVYKVVKAENLQKAKELKIVYEIKKADELNKNQEIKMVYELRKAQELGNISELKKVDELKKVLELKKVKELKGNPIQLKIIGNDAKNVVLSTKGNQKAYEVYLSGDKEKAVALKKFDELILKTDVKNLQIVKEKAGAENIEMIIVGEGGKTQAKLIGGVSKSLIVTGTAQAGTIGSGTWIMKSGDADIQKFIGGSGQTIQIVTESVRDDVQDRRVVLKISDELKEVKEFTGITSPIKYHSEKKIVDGKEVSYMIIISGDEKPQEVTRVIQPVQVRNWIADDGTTSIIIGPAKSQTQDKTKNEFEFKGANIKLNALKQGDTQSTIARNYVIAVDATQAQSAQNKLVRELQIVDQEKLQKDRKQAVLERQLAQLKVELYAINKQAERKDVQVKLQAEMKYLEVVLSQLQKSNTASGKALQNYITVGKALNVDQNKALLNLSKKQNQLTILLEESKKRGDEKQAVEFEKMIELFVVREAQAKDQVNQAQVQYRVASALAGNVAAEKQAQANTITATALAGSTQAARNYTIATPAYTTSSGRQTNNVLVIPSGKTLDAEEYRIAIENMQTMALILKKKQDMGVTAVSFGMFQGSENRIFNFTGSADDVQAIYLQGYGALFMMTVDYPLLAPVEKKIEPKKKAGDDVWEKARQEIKGGKQGAFGIVSDRFLLSRTKKSAQDYNEEKVVNLKNALLEGLRHASNMGHVKNSEWITIHVTGAGQPIIEVIQDIKFDSTTDDVVVDLTISGDVVRFDSNANQNFTVTKTDPQKVNFETITLNPQKTSEPTYMLIQAQKRDVNRLADNRISFEEFIEEATVLIY